MHPTVRWSRHAQSAFSGSAAVSASINIASPFAGLDLADQLAQQRADCNRWPTQLNSRIDQLLPRNWQLAY
ncbi:MAG: hypothetical protein WKG03_04990 [Telluria sp.]